MHVCIILETDICSWRPTEYVDAVTLKSSMPTVTNDK